MPGPARLAAVLLAACSSTPRPAPQPPAAPSSSVAAELAVPFAEAPVLDGAIGEAEWARAATVALDRGASVRLLHDGARVYVAVTGPAEGSGFACLMLAEPGQIRVMHASQKLGSAIYTQAAPDGPYRPRSQTYDWQPADALARDEGWQATTLMPGAAPQQEFALAFDRLGLPGMPRPLALGYFHMKPGATDLAGASVIVWPTGLDDAVATVELVAGMNPADLTFAPSRWVILRPQPR